MKKLLTLSVLALSLSCNALAETPSLVEDGLRAYMKDGASAAVTVWFRGSAIENDKNQRLNTLSFLAQLEAGYGAVESYEMVATFSPTSRLRRVYAICYYAKGPAYMCFDLYNSSSGWIICLYNINPKPLEVFPRELLERMPNHSPDPTPAPGMSPAGQESRHG